MAPNRTYKIWGVGYNGSGEGLGGRTAITSLYTWPDRTDTLVGLRIGQDPENGHLGLAAEVSLRNKLVSTCEAAVVPLKKRNI